MSETLERRIELRIAMDRNMKTATAQDRVRLFCACLEEIKTMRRALTDLVDADDELPTDYLHDEMNDARLAIGRAIRPLTREEKAEVTSDE